MIDTLVDQRYYDAWSGTFWSPDPTGLAAVNSKNPLSWNRYTYGLNDPINGNDPTGRVDCQAYNEYLRDVGGIDDLGLCGDNGDGSTSGGGGGGGGFCGGSYFDPSPNPLCYVPPPIIGGGDDGPPTPECFVELKYRAVYEGGVKVGNHSYVWVSNGTSDYVLEGEPSGKKPKLGKLIGVETPGDYGDPNHPGDNALQDSEVGRPYVGPDACDKVAQLMANTTNYIKALFGGKTPAYNALHFNSNTFAHALLFSVGLDIFGSPPNAPGWN